MSNADGTTNQTTADQAAAGAQSEDFGQQEQLPPSEAVVAMGRLVGSWTVTGGAEGTVRYEWMPGEYFLLQHVQLQQLGEDVTGLEVFGQLHPFGPCLTTLDDGAPGSGHVNQAFFTKVYVEETTSSASSTSAPTRCCSTPPSTATPSTGPKTATKPEPLPTIRWARVRALCVRWSLGDSNS